MPVLALWHLIEIKLDPHAALSTPSRRMDEVSPAAPISWMATIVSVGHQFQAGLDQQLFR